MLTETSAIYEENQKSHSRHSKVYHKWVLNDNNFATKHHWLTKIKKLIQFKTNKKALHQVKTDFPIFG